MSNTDMKLLMEQWKKYTTLIENSDQLGSIYLLERKSNTRVKKDFKVLLEDFDNGKITGDQLYKYWNASMLYEHKLLTELSFDLKGIDWEKEEKMLDDPDYKPHHERPGMLQKAWERSKDWVLEKSIQVYEMAKRGVTSAVKAAGNLIEKAKDFAADHPEAAKVISVVALSLAMFALMSALDPDSAEAAIKAPTEWPAAGEGGLKPGARGQISDLSYEALRGLIHDTKGTGASLEMRAEAMNIVDTAQQAGEVVDFAKLQSSYGKFANKQLLMLDGAFKLAREGDEEAYRFIKEMVKVGKKAVYRIGGAPTR
jgi:hypothetical protein